MKYVYSLLFTCCLASVATAELADWEGSATAFGAEFIATGVSSPTEMDIGTYDAATGGGVTYEFIYNADVGGASSAFMGSLAAPAGESAGLKLDQWNNTGMYGATAFGVADFTSTTPYVLNQDAHVVYVADGTDMTLFVNGAQTDVMSGASFALSGVTGIGHAYNHGNGGSVDPLNGTIIGAAVYDSALSSDAIAANFAAYTVPEPGSALLLALGCLCGWSVRRRR